MLSCSETDVILIALTLICHALLTTAHQVHTYVPHESRSRVKGQVACYACIAYVRQLTTFNFMDFMTQPNAHNVSKLHGVLSEGGMRIPVYAERCAETRPGTNPNFHGAQISLCPNTENEKGACIKLKGHLNGEAYVYRNCWSEMWKDARPYQRQMSERCFNDRMVQSFVNTEQNTICFCEDDLCNRSSPQFIPRASSFFLLYFLSACLAILSVYILN